MAKKKERGQGGVYKRGDIYWIYYNCKGKQERESSKSKRRDDAMRLLKKRQGQIAEGKLPGIHFEKVTFEDLAQDLITDYQFRGNKSEPRLWNLRPFFEGMRVVDITTPVIQKYIQDRQKAGGGNATINRELAALKKMLNLGARHTPPKVDRVPHIPMLKEPPARKGYVDAGAFGTFLSHLPDYLRPAAEFGASSGWRKSEVFDLTWDRVDLKQRTVTLDAGSTKNEEPRTLYMSETDERIFRDQFKGQQLGCPYVFHRDGKQIKDFRKAWKTASEKAGLPGLIFHDLRRIMATDMDYAGATRSQIKRRAGWKTDAVFYRYNIGTEEGDREAAQRYAEYRKVNGENDRS